MSAPKAKRSWLGRLGKFALAALAISFVMHPAMMSVAPLLDLVGTLGIDGLLYLIEFQVLLWLLPFLTHALIPKLTVGWNTYVAPRMGWRQSENVVADGALHVFHGAMRRFGHEGMLLYLIYIAVAVHLHGLAGAVQSA